MKTENENVNSEATTPETEPAVETGTESAEGRKAAVRAPEEAKVEKAIRESVYASMGIGIVPIALFNIAAVTASNLDLARKLSELYGVEFKEGVAKKIIISVAGAGAGLLASPLVETAVIGFPLVGLPLAVGTRPILSGMTTYAIGRMFVTHFERGGNFLSANAESMKEDFTAAYQNSREWLGNAIIGKKKAEPANA